MQRRVRLKADAALAIAACAAALSLPLSARPLAAPPDVDGLLSRVAEAVMSYYARAQSILCVEITSSVRPGIRRPMATSRTRASSGSC
jgi:hypothetical protein